METTPRRDEREGSFVLALSPVRINDFYYDDVKKGRLKPNVNKIKTK